MDDATRAPAIRLTEFAHGGGCGCKLSPAVLRDLLAGTPMPGAWPRLLVGTETADDAAVWRLEDGTCMIATTDFFMPVVDDPYDFGRIAATNAISDVYAMGGTPIFALAILGMPLGKLPVPVVREILAGGAAACTDAGIPVAGGHSIDTAEPIYGLAVLGTCREEHLRRNVGALAGDALILTKGIGVGIYANALRKGVLDAAGYAEMLASTTQLNRAGAWLGREVSVHAMTDVTGFGLLGHALEMARAGGVTLTIDAGSVPLLPRAAALCAAGNVTGASHRNWDAYGAEVDLPDSLPEATQHLLTDAQTSGGLLVSCAAEVAPGLVRRLHADGFIRAAVIGTVASGPGRVVIRHG
jgi:selenide,water dikinase